MSAHDQTLRYLINFAIQQKLTILQYFILFYFILFKFQKFFSFLINF